MDPQKLQELRKLVSGKVVTAGDAVYAKASHMQFGTIKPAVVVRPVSAEDVAATVGFIRVHKLPFAIRSGGHGGIATRLADGLLLIDMSGLATVEVVDEAKHLVRVGAGALWGDVAGELEKHGLGISSGDTRTVGVGGLSTGGGLGWMIRKYGPLVDNIAAVEVVTADGSIVTASDDENADLFWAVRGGGSNFGVVTHFTFRAHPVAGIIDGIITYPVKDVGKLLKGWRDAMRQAPAELTTMINILPSFNGQPPAFMLRGCFEGTDKAAADRAFAPFLALGKPVHQDIAAKPYKKILEEGMPLANIRVIGHNMFVKEFTDEVIDAIDTICRAVPTPIVQVRHLAGAMQKHDDNATAFSHRDSEVLIVHPTFVAPNATKKEIAAAEAPWRVLEPFGQGAYLNLLSEDTGQEVAQAYPPATLQRLKRIKARYDPDNLFTSNYNITPTA